MNYLFLSHTKYKTKIKAHIRINKLSNFQWWPRHVIYLIFHTCRWFFDRSDQPHQCYLHKYYFCTFIWSQPFTFNSNNKDTFNIIVLPTWQAYLWWNITEKFIKHKERSKEAILLQKKLLKILDHCKLIIK